MWGSIMPYARQNGEVIIQLNQRSSIPPPPYELIGMVQEGTYQRRMSDLIKMLKRYYWATWLKVYLFFAIALSLIAPWPIMVGIQAAFTNNIDLSTDPTDANGNVILTESQVHQFVVARAVSFAAIIGAWLFIWTPYSIWNAMGTKKINKLLDSFTEQDSNPVNPVHKHLRWTLRNPSTFSARANLVVRMQVEAMKSVSNFHPQAYLPTYIAGAPSGVWDPSANDGKGAYVNQTARNGEFRPPSQPPASRGSMDNIPLGNDLEKMV